MSRKHKHTHPRTIKLNATFHAPKAGTYKYEGNIYSKKFRILGEDGDAVPLENIHIELSRSRESCERKGAKILCNIPHMQTASLSPNEALLTFDYVYAVDTNTKCVDGSWLSAGCVCYLASCQKIETQYRHEFSLIRQVTSTNTFCRYQMEQHVWNDTIAFIQTIVPSDCTVALVVDCDLENIQKYNERLLKIRDAAYLPENFTLIYASADNKDTIANKMISFCDSCAKEALAKLISQKKQESE
ncbi:hypothetical protein [Pseudoflavonifractor sp. AF19-9AC]|uniref:hypothetical protein n=1 Tax=Pseudoflavonifractor sp. AF19-9AC TaxID=2292244 RepID=UPI0011C401B2|nr:hypothetical protein [Pseudoflavonifractor sp. AF19-9AC]